MRNFRTSRLFDVLFLLCLGGVLVAAFVYRVALGDWVFFQTHEPSSRTVSIASAANLTPGGARLLYRGDPQFVDALTISDVCSFEQLGCLTEKGQIFVLDDPANPDQSTVTAVHEMLHLAYRRLSDSEKAGLTSDINQQLLNSQLQQELRAYAAGEEQLDEAHAILGTEFADLPTGLESYYETYFIDRHQIVSVYQTSIQ